MEQKIQKLLTEMLKNLDFTYEEVKVEKNDNTYNINIESEKDAKFLIGKNAMTLKAIQHLLKVIVSKELSDTFNIFLDVNSYRKNQEENVKKLALEAINKVRETKQDQNLPPMSSYFRRIVHTYLSTDEFKDLKTESTGEDYFRHIIIKMV
jgi:spoIIIJ-associated protein